MSYLVIARKYRPQRFADLIGQEHVSVTLRNQLQNGKHAHAYLFTGPRGVGKTSAARLLAKALRCLNPGKDAEPCNECDACVGVNNGSSLDVLEIDAASNTGVDNIRDLRDNVNYSAAVGKYRVYIVDEVHMLSTAAFNALLKTVEEPPPHVVFIFATTELHKVPATIQSRCQRFDFKRIPASVMMDLLKGICAKENVKADDAALRTIVLESEGCVRDAQSLLDQAIAFCGGEITTERLETALGLLDRASLFEIARAIGAHDAARALKSTNTVLSRGADAKVLLARLVEFLCDLHYRAFAGVSRIEDPEQDAVLQELQKQLAPDEIVRAMDLALRAQAGLHANINASVTAEALVVKLCLQRPVSALGAGVSHPASASSGNAASANRTSQGSAAASPRPSFTPRSESAPHPGSAPGAGASPSAPASSSGAASGARPSFGSAAAGPASANNGRSAPTQASSPAPAAPAPSDGTAPTATLENFIRLQKPAWTPVLQSLLELKIENGALQVRAKPDFAGKRLASPDGIALLQEAYGVKKATVELDASLRKAAPTNSADPTADKRALSREHDAVKSALKIFEGTITETKILEDERPNRGRK